MTSGSAPSQAVGSGSARGSLRVMIVDDHPVVRLGISRMIEDEPDMTVCGESETAAEALTYVRDDPPDLAVVDLSLAESSGLELIKTLSTLYPKMPILVLSMHDERLYAERALRAGASGYVMKQEARRDLLAAIHRVAAGKTYLSAEMSERLLSTVSGRWKPAAALSPFERLTDREREVFGLIGRGLGTRQIAASLGLSVKTIESHRARIKEKMGLRTASELIRSAATWAS